MKLSRAIFLIAATAFAAGAPAQSAGLPPIPEDVSAMLLEHRGQWCAEGWMIEGDKRTPVKASWECKAAVNGVGNVCTWNHEWVDRPHDSAVDLMGYDPKLKVLRMQRVNDDGIMGPGVEVTVRGNTMTVVRESTGDDGKPRIMRNEIVVAKPGEWRQHITFDEDGRRVREWQLTQRRVAKFEALPSRASPPDKDIPADVIAWLEGQRGKWRSEGVIVNGEQRTKAFATWECAAAVNGIGNVCTWHHEWTDRPADSAMDIIGYDPIEKRQSIARVTDAGYMEAPVTVEVQGNAVRASRPFVDNGRPAEQRNEVIVKSRDERAQRMSVEVDGQVVREFIITHRRIE